MSKKYPLTTEMAEIFPSWAKIRTDDQSVGYTVLNALGKHLDKMDKTIIKQKYNTFLPIVNLDEIDILYKVQLPAAFTFSEDTTDPLFPVKETPIVSGYIGLDSYLVEADRTNTIEDFWYNASPNRYTLDSTLTGTDHNLLTFTASGAPLDVDLDHHLGGGFFWIETSGGTNYIRIEEGELFRARIIIRGITRVGLEDSETLVFPWDMKQKSNKEWKTITKIEVFDMEDEVTIYIRSGDLNNEPYLDFYNARYSDNRRKIDSFWGVSSVEGHPTIDLITYTTDQWEAIAAGYPEKQIVQSWELLDENDLPVTGIDIAIQPFSERGWITTNDGRLYQYELTEDMVSGIDLLKDRTHGSHVTLEYDTRYLVIDEYFRFIPWHQRAIKEIASYRIWYQTPSGTKYGLLNGSPVSYTSNFTIYGQQLQRSITNKISVQLTERGEYLFVLEVTYIDGEEHTEKVIAKTCYKKPLAYLDISADVPIVSGIEFDSDQKLWVRDNSGTYYEIGLHYDTMLIDYDRKILYLREEYDSVDVIV